ncbi:hypothetical protein SC206_09995 [Rouxiella sp. T17]|uniref:hypothetical protein n=1 Tax=Rouxiella sp. T17 TaxID=3085684 RepID=UPI002FC6132C
MFRVDLLPINPTNPTNSLNNLQDERIISAFGSGKALTNTHKELLSNYQTTLDRAMKRFGDERQSSRKLCLRGVADLKNMAKAIADESKNEGAAGLKQEQTLSRIRAYSGYVARVSPHCNSQFGVNLYNGQVNSPQEAVKEARQNNREVRLENKIQRLSGMRNKLVEQNNSLYDDLRTFRNTSLPQNPLFYNHRKTVDRLTPRNHLARDDLACRHNVASLDILASGLPQYFADTRDDIVNNCRSLEMINLKLIALSLSHHH